MQFLVAGGVLALSVVIGLVNLTAAIILLIQLFKRKGVAHGIFGICCGIYTFIWGWMTVAEIDASEPPVLGLSYRSWMMIWTGCFVASLGLQCLGAVAQQM